jgi:hypothetical protein
MEDMPQLTDAGRRFALASAETCLVARLALGLEDDWPTHYVRAAIESCNALGETALPRRSS